jgi:hypothetical protein
VNGRIRVASPPDKITAVSGITKTLLNLKTGLNYPPQRQITARTWPATG